MDHNTRRIANVGRNHTTKRNCPQDNRPKNPPLVALHQETPPNPHSIIDPCLYNNFPRNTGTTDSHQKDRRFASWRFERGTRKQESSDLDLDSDRGRDRRGGLDRAALPLPLPPPPKPPSPEGEDDEGEGGERRYGRGDERQRRGGHGRGEVEGEGRGAKMAASPSPFLRCAGARV